MKVETSKDIIKLPKFAEILDRLLEVHHELGNLAALAEYEEYLNTGLANLRNRCIHRDESASYGSLLSKVEYVSICQLHCVEVTSERSTLGQAFAFLLILYIRALAIAVND